jgi:hypothetical protein
MMASFLEKAIFEVGLVAPLVSWPLLAPSNTFIPDAEEELCLLSLWPLLFSEQASRPLDSPAFASSNN